MPDPLGRAARGIAPSRCFGTNRLWRHISIEARSSEPRRLRHRAFIEVRSLEQAIHGVVSPLESDLLGQTGMSRFALQRVLCHFQGAAISFIIILPVVTPLSLYRLVAGPSSLPHGMRKKMLFARQGASGYGVTLCRDPIPGRA